MWLKIWRGADIRLNSRGISALSMEKNCSEALERFCSDVNLYKLLAGHTKEHRITSIVKHIYA